MRRGKRLGVNLLGVCIALGIAFLAIMTANSLLEKGEEDRIGRVEQVVWEKGNVAPLYTAEKESAGEYQMLVDKLLCWTGEEYGGVQQSVREPSQGELDMERAYLRCLDELKKLQDAGMKLGISEDRDSFSLTSAELISSYNERFGECARWFLGIEVNDAKKNPIRTLSVQMDASTGCIYAIELEDAQGFQNGTMMEFTQAMARYLGLDPDTDLLIYDQRQISQEAWAVLQTLDQSLEISGYKTGSIDNQQVIEEMEQAIAEGVLAHDMPIPASWSAGHYLSVSVQIAPGAPILYS